MLRQIIFLSFFDWSKESLLCMKDLYEFCGLYMDWVSLVTNTETKNRIYGKPTKIRVFCKPSLKDCMPSLANCNIFS